MITEPGIYIDVPDADYHADPCPAPSLTASVAKVLLEQSPLHAYTIHPKLGGHARASTDEMEHGALVHALLLGRGPEIVSVEAKDWRTKVAKAARDEARARGALPVLERHHGRARLAAQKIRERLADLGHELGGQSEVTIAWREATPDGDVWARGRIDHLDGATILDLKTCTSATAGACVRRIIDYGYDVQRAAYVRGLTAIRPELGGRVRFVFAFAEVEPPYGVIVAPLDGVLRDYGERRWVEACERWARALRTGRWFGPENPQHFEAPSWLLARMEGA